jgi:hypothetical protein
MIVRPSDATTNVAHNPAGVREFGVNSADAEAGLPLAEFVKAIDVRDVERVMSVLNRSIENVEPYEAEYRVHGTGDERVVVARGLVEVAPGGRKSMSGVVIDITEENKTAAALQEQTRALSILNRAVNPNDPVLIPPGAQKCDWELELAIIIGEGGAIFPKLILSNTYWGYAICNDVSERAYQLELGGQWVKGKSAPIFGLVGPWIATTDEMKDPGNLSMFLEANDGKMQSGSAKTMIFSVATIVSYCSKFMKLEPGDIITTGTPPGAGMAKKPQRFLKHGDTMRLYIDGLGEQKQTVVAL